jgi:hypothetical protein
MNHTDAVNYLTFPFYMHKLVEISKEEGEFSEVDAEVFREFDTLFQMRVRQYAQTFPGLELTVKDRMPERMYWNFQRELNELRSYSLTGPWQ